MPYRSETQHLLIPKPLKRSVKLTDEQRAEIKQNAEGLSTRALAARYGVSRRLVQFILDPAKEEACLDRRKERGGSARYYDQGKHRGYVRSCRQYRRSIEQHLEKPV